MDVTSPEITMPVETLPPGPVVSEAVSAVGLPAEILPQLPPPPGLTKTTAAPAETTELTEATALTETTERKAENCIKNHVLAAMGIGLIPSALLDAAAITAVEIKLIRDLAKIYSFPVPNKLVAYKVLISLIGSIGPVYFSARMHAAWKGVPLVGHALYVGLLSATGGAAVYAVGKIFQKHYQSGGTFLSKDNQYLRDYFKEKYGEGKQAVRGYAAAKAR